MTIAAVIKSAERDLILARHLVRGLMLLTEELVPCEDVCDALAEINARIADHITGALETLAQIKPVGGVT